MKTATTTLLFLLVLLMIAPPAQAATLDADDPKPPALFQRAVTSQAPAILSRDAFNTSKNTSTTCDLCAGDDSNTLETMTLEYTGPTMYLEFRVVNPSAGTIFGPTLVSTGDIIFLERPGNSKGIGNNVEILAGGTGASGSGTIINVYVNGNLQTDSRSGKAFHSSCSPGTPQVGDLIEPSTSNPAFTLEVLGGGHKDDPEFCQIDLACTAPGAPLLTVQNESRPGETTNLQTGDQIKFTAPFTNQASNLTAQDVKVTATYDQTKFMFLSASGGDGQDGSTAGEVVFTINSLAPSASVSLMFRLEVKSGADGSSDVTTVVTTANQPDPDSSPGAFTPAPNTEDDECLANFAALPVELTAFDAQADGRSATLSWRTASETNNAGFELQHRYLDEAGSSKKEFTARAFIEGHGTTTEAHTYSFRLDNLEPGRHVFRLKQIDYDGTFDYSPEIEIAVDLPEAFLVSPVYPNPFNPQASFSFSVSRSQQVTVSVYNMLGQRVMTLFDGVAAEGTARTLQIDGSGLESGTYIVRVLGESFVNTQTITLVK